MTRSRRFRASSKFAIAYADSFGELSSGNEGYYLATAFDEIDLQKVGLLGLTGLTVQVPLARDLLASLGIDVEVFRRAEYKSAMETLTDSALARTASSSTPCWTRSTASWWTRSPKAAGWRPTPCRPDRPGTVFRRRGAGRHAGGRATLRRRDRRHVPAQAGLLRRGGRPRRLRGTAAGADRPGSERGTRARCGPDHPRRGFPWSRIATRRARRRAQRHRRRAALAGGGPAARFGRRIGRGQGDDPACRRTCADRASRWWSRWAARPPPGPTGSRSPPIAIVAQPGTLTGSIGVVAGKPDLAGAGESWASTGPRSRAATTPTSGRSTSPMLPTPGRGSTNWSAGSTTASPVSSPKAAT